MDNTLPVQEPILGRTDSSHWHYYLNNMVSAFDTFWQYHWKAIEMFWLLKWFNLMWMKKRFITWIVPKIFVICFKWYNTHFHFRCWVWPLCPYLMYKVLPPSSRNRRTWSLTSGNVGFWSKITDHSWKIFSNGGWRSCKTPLIVHKHVTNITKKGKQQRLTHILICTTKCICFMMYWRNELWETTSCHSVYCVM